MNIDNVEKVHLDYLSKKCLEVCNAKNWERNWSNGGCYLHLESSEFIESLRGKNGDPIDEAADVFFVLLAMLEEHNIPVNSVIHRLIEKHLLDENG